MSYRLFYRLFYLLVRNSWTVIPSDTVFFKKTVKSIDFQRLTGLPSDTVFLSNGCYRQTVTPLYIEGRKTVGSKRSGFRTVFLDQKKTSNSLFTPAQLCAMLCP